MITKCSFCDKKPFAMYLCKDHYFNTKIVPLDYAKCNRPGCYNEKYKNNMCRPHNVSVLASRKNRRCTIEGCTRVIRARGMCRGHLIDDDLLA